MNRPLMKELVRQSMLQNKEKLDCYFERHQKREQDFIEEVRSNVIFTLQPADVKEAPNKELIENYWWGSSTEMIEFQ